MASLEDEAYELQQASAKRTERTACGEEKGTVPGYMRHMRAKPKERACAECRHAWRLYYRKYKNDPTNRKRMRQRELKLRDTERGP
jgi:hypothetical protein